MGIISNQRNRGRGCGFQSAGILILLALVAFIGWALWREIGSKPDESKSVTAAQIVTSPETPSPTATADTLRATLDAGSALDIEQKIAINAQILDNERLAGTIAADRATLEAGIVVVAANDARTATAHTGEMSAALTGTPLAATAQVMGAMAAEQEAESEFHQQALPFIYAAVIMFLFTAAMVALRLLADLVRYVGKTLAPVWEDAINPPAEEDENDELKQPITAEITSNQGRTTNIYNLRCTLEQAQYAAECVKDGKGLTYGALLRRKDLFTRTQVEDLQEDLIEQGLGEWRNVDHHDQGMRLLPAGWALMERIYQDDQEKETKS